MWKLICEMGGNMRVKSLDAYDIKNDIADVNSKEILTHSNNLIYKKIKSHFREPLIINYQEHFSNLSRNFS